MAAGPRAAEPPATEESQERPTVSVCEGCPGRSIFLETGNTDGWIASDLTVDISQ